MIPGGVQEKVHFTTWYHLDWNGGNDERNKESNLLKHVRAYINLYIINGKPNNKALESCGTRRGYEILLCCLVTGKIPDSNIWNLPIKGLTVSNCIWDFTAGPCAKSKAVHCKVLAAESPRCRFFFVCQSHNYWISHVNIHFYHFGSPKCRFFVRVPKSQLLDVPCISIHLTWRVHLGNFIISVSYPLIGHFSWWATSIHWPSVTPQRGEPSKPPRVSQANLAWTSATPKAARNSGHFPSHRAAGGVVIAGFHMCVFPYLVVVWCRVLDGASK